MHTDPSRALAEFKRMNNYLIAIDSDGCVFDSMEIKHKECFIPTTIEHFGLQAVAKYAREAAEFVNLYSQTRGINRFPALRQTLELLSEREEVNRRGANLPRLTHVRAWIEREANLSDAGLSAAVDQARGEERVELERLLAWSRSVNATIGRWVRGVPPFPFVRKTLEKAVQRADMIVCSATPGETLASEWNEHGLAQFVAVIAGQEMGTKTQQLKLAVADKFLPARVLMIGDAPGDLKAAQSNGVLFYPILPGREEASWRRLHDEALDHFFGDDYSGPYEQERIAEFLALLPTVPPWQAPALEQKSEPS